MALHLTPRLRLCTTCLRHFRHLARPRTTPHDRPLPLLRLKHSQPHRYRIATAGEQATPLKGFYADMLSHPLHQTPTATRTAPAPPPPDELPKTAKEETLAKARIVFGSRLAGPAERREKRAAASKTVAGVLVPPKPQEPDNCCMSGCVNCVWDVYGEELEEWARAEGEAKRRLRAQQQHDARLAGRGSGRMVVGADTPTHVASSMDDDGGGSETNWDVGDALGAGGGLREDEEIREDELFKNVPVGIREFMKTEKRLKEMHAKEEEAHAA